MVKSQPSSHSLRNMYRVSEHAKSEGDQGGETRIMYDIALHTLHEGHFSLFFMQPYAPGRVTSHTLENGFPKVLNPRLSIPTPSFSDAYQVVCACATVTGHTQAPGEQHTMENIFKSVDSWWHSELLLYFKSKFQVCRSNSLVRR